MLGSPVTHSSPLSPLLQPQHSGGPGCPYLAGPGGPHIRCQCRQPSVCRKGGKSQSGLQAGVQAAKPRRRPLEVMEELGTRVGLSPEGAAQRPSSHSSPGRPPELALPCWCPAHFTCLPGTMGLPTCHYYLQSAHLAGTSTLLLLFLVYYLLNAYSEPRTLLSSFSGIVQ